MFLPPADNSAIVVGTAIAANRSGSNKKVVIIETKDEAE